MGETVSQVVWHKCFGCNNVGCVRSVSPERRVMVPSVNPVVMFVFGKTTNLQHHMQSVMVVGKVAQQFRDSGASFFSGSSRDDKL